MACINEHDRASEGPVQYSVLSRVEFIKRSCPRLAVPGGGGLTGNARVTLSILGYIGP